MKKVVKLSQISKKDKPIMAFSFFIGLLVSSIYCDVKSDNGQILFDSNSDGQPEMTLNATGLGVGMTPSSNLNVDGNVVISETLTVGSTTVGASNLNVNGSYAHSVDLVEPSVSYTNLEEHSIAIANTESDNVGLRLPFSGNHVGKVFSVKKSSSINEVTLVSEGSTIEGYSELVLPTGSFSSVKVMATESNWMILNQYNSYETAVASENLLIHYGFEESAGTTVSSLNSTGNIGTLTNFEITGNAQTGKIGQSLFFDGDDHYIDASMSGNLTEITITMWFFHDADSWDSLITLHDSGSESFHLGPKGSGSSDRVHLVVSGSTGQYAVNEFPFNQWYFISFTWDNSGDMSIRKNNVEVSSSSTIAIGESIYFNDIHIGASSSLHGSRYFNGYIDDVRVYNRVLTDGELTQIFESGNY